jgi:hypothetical protein
VVLSSWRYPQQAGGTRRPRFPLAHAGSKRLATTCVNARAGLDDDHTYGKRLASRRQMTSALNE